MSPPLQRRSRSLLRLLWPAQPAETMDARGQTRPLLEWDHLPDRPDPEDPRVQRMLERLDDAKWLNGWASPNFAVGHAGAVAFLGMTAGRLIFPDSWAGIAAGILVMYVCLCLPLALYAKRGLRRVAPRIVRICLADGVCPSCGYSIGEIASEPDGCIVCSECGGAWNAALVLRPTPVPRVDEHTAVRKLPRRQRRLAPGMDPPLGSPPRRAALDDRGRQVPLIHPGAAMSRAGTMDLADRGRLEAALAAIRRRGLPLRLLIALCSTGAFLWLVLLAYYNLQDGEGLSAVIAALMALAPAALVWGVLRSDIGTTRATVLDGMLRMDLCPSCATRLSSSPDTDGCRTCLNCSAAWASSPFS